MNIMIKSLFSLVMLRASRTFHAQGVALHRRFVSATGFRWAGIVGHPTGSCRGSVVTAAEAAPSSCSGGALPDDVPRESGGGHSGGSLLREGGKALLWLSPNRLRVRDNAALARAAELGPDGLSICLAWPYGGDARLRQLTPSEAFGHEALHAFNEFRGKLGQRAWIIPQRAEGGDGGGGGDRDPSSIVVQAVSDLRPAHVVVDSCLLDRHLERALSLREALQRTNSEDADYAPVVVEVTDNDLLVPFKKVPKTLGRSRRGGRALRWSTFLTNALNIPGLECKLPSQPLLSLPSPLDDLRSIMLTSSALSTEAYPPWAEQLMSEWGDISEEEAIRHVSGGRYIALHSSTNHSSSSPLTEAGSKSTRLSPYLRWGVISPRRALIAGVRARDLLWRDWSRVCYGLLGPLRRGEAVLGHMDAARRHGRVGPDDDDDNLFGMWCVGNTGSKMVDAGMHQLWAEGWMPRGVRILAAACLVEGLGVDWRRGRDWFDHTLVDHDPAINELMWQNAGFCGVDPFYTGVRWEGHPRGLEQEKYVERWSAVELNWPSDLRPYSERDPQSRMLSGAESRRAHLRESGIYRAARTVANSGVRVAWPGLVCTETILEGEVIGVGMAPLSKLKI